MPTPNEQAAATLRAVADIYAGVPLADGDGTVPRLIAKLSAAAEARVIDRTVGAGLWEIGEAMVKAGPALADLDRAAAGIRALVAEGEKSEQVLAVALWVVLAMIARILPEADFRSRRVATDWRDRLIARFDAAIDEAAEFDDLTGYSLLRDLQARMIEFFAEAVRPLPRLVEKRFAVPLPALALAQRIYQDADRAGEIVDENHVAHPLFAPLDLEVLSQ